MDHVFRYLSNGTTLTKFDLKRRPEKKIFLLRLDTSQIVWTVPGKLKAFEGLVDIRDIKEIRRDKNSKDFERLPEEAHKCEKSHCFVIHYGSQFRLAAISCVADTEELAKKWVQAIEFLMKESVSYMLQLERWLRKEFYQRESRLAINFQEMKNFMYRANCKPPANRLKDAFQEFDTGYRGEINFIAFSAVYHKFIFLEQVFDDDLLGYSADKRKINLQECQQFLLTEQNEQWAKSDKLVQELMHKFLHDPKRDINNIYLTVPEFVGYLFSKHNTIWDPAHDVVNQDMDQPLTHYWIASSHNTYLTGNALTSDSSVEAYVRCLRMGSRCIELDTWDGPDEMPFIYHGRTLTSKIRFIEVVECIRDHAFATSDYPVILSIEDHCSLPQQRRMAMIFQKVLGEMLLVLPCDKDEAAMPSPNQLKRKIIIKHKRLPDGCESVERLPEPIRDNYSFESASESADISLYKNGIMYLEDRLNHEWIPHYFVLTGNKLCYMEKPADNENSSQSDVENDENRPPKEPEQKASSDDQHFAEKWFHGKLVNGRKKANQVLIEYAHLGDGTFLVRDSDTFVGDFSLSFLRASEVHHCRIRSKPEQTRYKFYLVEKKTFDNLYDLITYYRSNPVKNERFDIFLKEPAPQPESHKAKDWYYDNLTRQEAEDMLRKLNSDGAFLVRKSGTKDGDFVISFRADKQLKHCRITREGRLFVIGSAQFETLVELIDYYEKYPLFRKIKLKYPVTEELLNNMEIQNTEQNGESGSSEYMNLSVTCRTLFDFLGQRNDELTFSKGVMVTNVVKQDGGWWKGDFADQIQRWFPANYVEECDPVTRRESSDDNMLLGAQQKGSFEMSGCTIQEVPGGFNGKNFVFRLQAMNMLPIEIACDTEEEIRSWVDNIRECVRLSEETLRRERKREQNFNCAKELSNLTVYCRSGVRFDPYKNMFDFREMSSFSETNVAKWITPEKCKVFLKYNNKRFSRIYPMGTRVYSSNYDPMIMWRCGSQMVALNYQTPDAPMHLNHGKFMQNGRCGYVLQPAFMRQDTYDPYNASSLKGIVEPVLLSVTIIAGRHFVKPGKGIACPFVEVEVTGADDDSHKYKTNTIPDNGFNPVWHETCDFDIHNPDLALIRFIVQDVDMFGDANFLGQATFPVRCIRPGFRSVPLRNGWNDELELASLLVKIHFKSIKDEDPVLYEDIQKLRHEARDLERQIEGTKQTGQVAVSRELDVKLQEAHDMLQKKSLERQQKSFHSQSLKSKRPVKKLSRMSSVSSALSASVKW